MNNDYDKEQQQIKRAIVRGYRKGSCDHRGRHIPPEKRGMAGKGSRFRPPTSQRYRENYDRIFGKKEQ